MNLIKLAKKNTKKLKLESKLDRIDELQTKYIDLLEQKNKGFDLYIKYQEQCVELAKEKRNLKSQLAESKELCTSLTNKNEELQKQVEKLERKIKKQENANKKSTSE